MPSLFRFLTILGVLAAIVCGGLYAAAIYFEPVSIETAEPISGGVTINR